MVVRHSYGPEGPVYVPAQLESAWKPFAALLLRHDIEAGSVWAFVPEGMPEEDRRNFQGGSFRGYEELPLVGARLSVASRALKRG